MAELQLFSATPADLDAVTLYRILRLRVDVFVVEQACPYPELDGRDLEPSARWMWASEADRLLATLRVLSDGPATARIGRVATAIQARSAGVGGRLLRYALDQIALDHSAPDHSAPDHSAPDVVLDAQSNLADWYRRFGFEVDSDELVEDGIAHLPMRRPAGTA
ncbi:MAG: GNAT family N-acetyltransferase [Jatrophihabitans sp.]